jgi:hypothetical protein
MNCCCDTFPIETQVGKAVANVHATYAVLVEPFRRESPETDVKDYVEACAMGWKPERSLQPEFLGWLSAHLDDSDKFSAVKVWNSSATDSFVVFVHMCCVNSNRYRCQSARKTLTRFQIDSNACSRRSRIPLTVPPQFLKVPASCCFDTTWLLHGLGASARAGTRLSPTSNLNQGQAPLALCFSGTALTH